MTSLISEEGFIALTKYCIYSHTSPILITYVIGIT